MPATTPGHPRRCAVPIGSSTASAPAPTPGIAAKLASITPSGRRLPITGQLYAMEKGMRIPQK
uniref:Uncharacterized protein n=1 Tax=Oryza punctata TaxID=4537 RepID=A0A0E0KQG8_ORYPU